MYKEMQTRTWEPHRGPDRKQSKETELLETRSPAETVLRWFSKIVQPVRKAKKLVKRILADGSMGVGSSIVLGAWESHVKGKDLTEVRSPQRKLMPDTEDWERHELTSALASSATR